MALQVRRRLRYPLGVVVLVLGIAVVEAAFGLLARGAVNSGFPAWLPTFGAVGRTVVVYGFLADAYTFLLVPAAAFWLGMQYVRTE